MSSAVYIRGLFNNSSLPIIESCIRHVQLSPDRRAIWIAQNSLVIDSTIKKRQYKLYRERKNEIEFRRRQSETTVYRERAFHYSTFLKGHSSYFKLWWNWRSGCPFCRVTWREGLEDQSMKAEHNSDLTRPWHMHITRMLQWHNSVQRNNEGVTTVLSSGPDLSAVFYYWSN